VPLVALALTAVLLWLILPADIESRIRMVRQAAPTWPPPWAVTSTYLRYLGAPIAALGLTLWIDYTWVYTASTLRLKSLFWPVMAAWIVLRGLPLLAPAAVWVANQLTNANIGSSWLLAGVSPIGTLILVVAPERVGVMNRVPGSAIATGLLVQLGIAVAMTVWASRRRRGLVLAWGRPGDLKPGMKSA
jgi:hypothetical protein